MRRLTTTDRAGEWEGGRDRARREQLQPPVVVLSTQSKLGQEEVLHGK